LRPLEIDECVDWISHELILEKEVTFRYSRAQMWEFLIFTANNYLLNAKKLQKLERLTGMVLLQIETYGGTSKVWFGRLAQSSCVRHKSISDTASGQTDRE
jgi:hypothetical protein